MTSGGEAFAHVRGVGSLRDTKVWLKPGDEVVISSPQLCVLETRLA